ncbi:MAG: DUF4879 domain-containing protein [Candidatus Methylumidiphilus sp.]
MRSHTFLFFSSIAMALASGLSGAAPAPGISYVEVRHVGSTNQGWEDLGPNDMATRLDHGGAQLRVITVEIGYGKSPMAFLDGVRLPNSANYSTTTFCSSNYLIPCRAGQTVMGWVRYWNLDGKQSGRFYYQTTSTNFPNNTLGDGMYIR